MNPAPVADSLKKDSVVPKAVQPAVQNAAKVPATQNNTKTTKWQK